MDLKFLNFLKFYILTFLFMQDIMQQINQRGPKMKQTIITTLILLFSFFAYSPAQANDANEAYIKAVTTPDVNLQAKLFKEYLTKFEGKGTQYENFVHANLCILNYRGKTASETIKHGEKALALGGLDDFTKCKILITLSGVYIHQGQDLEKAKTYASQVVQIAKTNENPQENSDQWKQFEGAGHFAHGQAADKGRDYRSAAKSYIMSYKILKNNQIAINLQKIGKSLYDVKFYKDAEEPFRVACQALKDFSSCTLYANTLYKNGKKDEALTLYKEAYAKQKNGKIAYSIGVILADKSKSDASHSHEAIKYLLHASFLFPEKSKQAMQLAQGIFFHLDENRKYNENVKEIQECTKKIEELTKTFNKKYENKDEEDLSEAEKKEMKLIINDIETEKKAIKKLEDEQKVTLEKFNTLIQETKQRLGIK